MELMENMTVVLVHPKRAGNIGSVARVMMNFGMRKLRIVSRRTPHRTFSAAKMAVHAKEILKSATVHESLSSAVEDCNIVLGTSGKFIADAPSHINFDDFGGIVQSMRKNKVAVVFGAEDRGLSAEELSHCNHTVQIPTHHEYTSMNISHAAAVVLFAFYNASRMVNARASKKLATRGSMERLYSDMRELYLRLGFLDHVNPDRMMKVLRSIYDRANIGERDANILMGIMRQTRWCLDNKKDSGT